MSTRSRKEDIPIQTKVDLWVKHARDYGIIQPCTFCFCCGGPIKMQKSVRNYFTEHARFYLGYLNLDNSPDIANLMSSEYGHVIAEAHGGTVHHDNLRIVCSQCNNDMGTENMIDWCQRMGYRPVHCYNDVMTDANSCASSVKPSIPEAMVVSHGQFDYVDDGKCKWIKENQKRCESPEKLARGIDFCHRHTGLLKIAK